nr:hypothetical protein [Kibdelosporangium sp. MJ126-NF4]CTQ99396.1 hypothetical protein [Kibdelosporangium sp. MJ126-NF4]
MGAKPLSSGPSLICDGWGVGVAGAAMAGVLSSAPPRAAVTAAMVNLRKLITSAHGADGAQRQLKEC